MVFFVLIVTLIRMRCRKKSMVLPVRQASPALMHLLPAEDNDSKLSANEMPYFDLDLSFG